MRVLWISHSPGNYKSLVHIGTGGWVAELQKEVEKIPKIELGIAFLHATDSKVVKDGNTTYFPINLHRYKGVLGEIINKFLYESSSNVCKNREKLYLQYFLNVIRTFKPDLIHIWGTEFFYVEIVKLTQIHCVVDIQCISHAWENAFFPPGVSKFDLIKFDGFKFFLRRGLYNTYCIYRKRELLERNILPYVKYWMGRTEWDKDIISFLSPDSRYFTCNRLLLGDFNRKEWCFHDRKEILIVSTIREGTYKGVDLILKTAELLKRKNFKFTWYIYGISELKFPHTSILKFYEKKFKIFHDEVNIRLMGKMSRNEIYKKLLESDIYVHPSYIENSCNAISEAQQLGLPVISVNVGGISSILAHNSGILVPSNDPLLLAAKIIQMKNPVVAKKYSENGKKEAENRNNKERVISQLLYAYDSILKNVKESTSHL